MRFSCSYMLFLLGFFFVMGFSLVAADYRASICNNASAFSNSSTYSTNLNTVMDHLRGNASQTGYNTSSYGQAPNRVYGLLQCMGKISGEKCANCLQDAKTHLQQNCGNDIGGLVWMDDCFLRYDNYSFISKLDTDHAEYLLNVNDVPNDVQAFKATTFSLLSNLSTKASDPANKGFAAASANFSSSDTVYGLAQCWRDISTKDCKTCLMSATQGVESCCSGKRGAQAMLGSCTVRYEINPFLDKYNRSSSPQGSPGAAPSTAPTPSPQGSPGATPSTAPTPSPQGSPGAAPSTAPTPSPQGSPGHAFNSSHTLSSRFPRCHAFNSSHTLSSRFPRRHAFSSRFPRCHAFNNSHILSSRFPRCHAFNNSHILSSRFPRCHAFNSSHTRLYF